MNKSERIRSMMDAAYAGGAYHQGIVARGRLYVYLLDGQGNIERCDARLYNAGCPE